MHVLLPEKLLGFLPCDTHVKESETMPGKCLGIVGQDPSDSKSSQLHVRDLPVLLPFIGKIFYIFP